jgi:hypothetical protein
MENIPSNPNQNSGVVASGISRRVIYYVLIAVALIAAGVLVYYFFFRTPPPKIIDFSRPSVVALDAVRTALIAKAKFSFPAIASSTAVSSVKNLPQQLLVFIPTDYTDASFNAVNYANGKKGYLINYLVNQKMADFYVAQEKLLSYNGWQRKTSSRAVIFGLMERENAAYQVRIEHFLTTDNKDQVVVRVLNK